VCNLYDMSLEGVQVDIRPEWSVLEQIPLTSLSKLSYDVGEPEDMYGLPSILWFLFNTCSVCIYPECLVMSVLLTYTRH
jgi:hypothetical protein